MCLRLNKSWLDQAESASEVKVHARTRFFTTVDQPHNIVSLVGSSSETLTLSPSTSASSNRLRVSCSCVSN